MRTALPLVGVGFVGLTLLLTEVRWVSRLGRVERLSPYQRGASTTRGSPWLSVGSIREVIGPLCRGAGSRLARSAGFDEDVAVRLSRIHSPIDATSFRVRQIGLSALSLGVALLAALALDVGPAVAAALILTAPVVVFLGVEQRLSRRSKRWQRRLTLELAVVSEQMGMLVSAGWSLGGAISRIADRGAGACASDMSRVRSRIQQGLTEAEALEEWAELAAVPQLAGVVAVLVLDRDAADLGRLIASEARSIRRDAHRDLIEAIERRTQQVWIPVTVAALVPGVLLMGVPFIDALRLFSS